MPLRGSPRKRSSLGRFGRESDPPPGESRNPRPRFFKSRGFQASLSILLAAAFLAFFLRQVKFAEIGQRIASASAGWLSLSLALALATFWLRAVRWTWILRPVGRVPLFPAFLSTAVGFAANNLPGKVGEVIRPAVLARSQKLPFSPLLASIVLERAFDGASVVFFFLVAAWRGLPKSSGFGRLLAPAALLLTLFALVSFSVFRRTQTERFLERIWRRLPDRVQPRVRSFAATFVDGFATLKDPQLLLLVSAGSIAMWFVINLQIYAILRAFHLSVPFSTSYVVTAFAVLGLMFPTPGGLGSYHLAVQFALHSLYDVEEAAASGVALLAHAVSFIPITLIGLSLFVASPLRRKGLRELAETESLPEP